MKLKHIICPIFLLLICVYQQGMYAAQVAARVGAEAVAQDLAKVLEEQGVKGVTEAAAKDVVENAMRKALGQEAKIGAQSLDDIFRVMGKEGAEAFQTKMQGLLTEEALAKATGETFADKVETLFTQQSKVLSESLEGALESGAKARGGLGTAEIDALEGAGLKLSSKLRGSLEVKRMTERLWKGEVFRPKVQKRVPTFREMEDAEKELTIAEKNAQYYREIKDEAKIAEAERAEKAARIKFEQKNATYESTLTKDAKALKKHRNLLRIQQREFTDAGELKVLRNEAATARAQAGDILNDISNFTTNNARRALRDLRTQLDGAKGRLRQAIIDRDPIAIETFGREIEGLQKEITAISSKLRKFGLKIKSISLAGFHFLTQTMMMGFAFAVPSIVQMAAEQLEQAKTLRATISRPARFGEIWMQMLKALISEPGALNENPVSFFPLYVGLTKPTTEQVKDRMDEADTDAYIANAPLFVSRDEWDNYAKAAIPGDFPGKMVELRTGAHIIGSGALVPGSEMIQLIGESKNPREEVLTIKIMDFVDEVKYGASRKEYFAYDRKDVVYKGDLFLGNLLDPAQNKTRAMDEYPDLPARDLYPAVFNASLQAMASGTNFGKFKVEAFKPLDEDTIKKLGGTKAVEKKPYPAMGVYVYQTADTPRIQSIRLALAENPRFAGLADAMYEYVLMLDDRSNPVPLQLPIPQGPYNFPSFSLNPNAETMLSLFDGTLYKLDGKGESSGMDVDNFIKNYAPDLITQIVPMRSFIQDKIQYGPFIINNNTLTVNPEHAKKGVHVYKISKRLENGGDDYVIATEGMRVTALPGAPSNFVSLVTSKIYDADLNLHNNENGGYPNVDYTIFQLSPDQAPLVVMGVPKEIGQGKIISQELNAPLGTLFMDYDINPNKVSASNIPDKQDQQWLAQFVGGLKNGAVQWPLPTPAPLQWALSDHGPVAAAEQGPSMRIGQLIEQEIPALRRTIDEAHEQWKLYSYKNPQVVARQIGTYVWIPGTRPVSVSATSAEDIKNGNFVYTSGFYPGDFLVFSADDKGTREFARQFDAQEPQRYAISITTGRVYDAQQEGKEVNRITDVEGLIARVQKVQNPFLPALKKQIDAAKLVIRGAVRNEQFGPNTAFGPYQFFLFKEDLDRGQFIYADVSAISKPLSINEKTLFNQIKDFFVAIELKEGLVAKPGSPDDPALDPANWIYGKKISAGTIRVLSLVNGILFDRGGTFQGFFRDFYAKAETGIDIQQSFLDTIFRYLKETWQSVGKSAEMRPALKNKIISLANKRFEQLLAEKKEIESVLRKERAAELPLDQNTKANIDTQPLIESLQRLFPPRFVKFYGGKYYMLGYNDAFESEPKELVSYTDFNAGDPNKDNRQAIVYDAQGKQMIGITGGALDAARAFIGLTVKPDGKQELGVPVFQSLLPLGDNMIKLDAAVLKNKLTTLQSQLKTALDGFRKDPKNKQITDQVGSVSAELRLYAEIYQSAVVVEQQKKDGKVKDDVFFNKALNSYFILVKNEGKYIDINRGYEYGTDGNPYIERSWVYRPASGQGMLLFAETVDNFQIAWFSPDNKKVFKLLRSDSAEGTLEGKEATREVHFNADFGDLILYYLPDTDEYKVLARAIDKVEAEEVGTFKRSNLVYTIPQYYHTRTNGDGKFVSDDEAIESEVALIWDGSAQFDPQYIVYKEALVKLTKSSAKFFKGNYQTNGTSKSIQVSKQTAQYGSFIKGLYVTIVDGQKKYDMIPVMSFLNPEMPTLCRPEKELKTLNYWKQCVWQMNMVIDTFSNVRLVNTIPSRLTTVSRDQMQQVLEGTPKGRQVLVHNNLQNIFYDARDNRYLYQLTAADRNKPYWDERMLEGSYVDLFDGVVYTSDTVGTGRFPDRAWRMSQLMMLLNELELAVAPIADPKGEPLFDQFGIPVIDPETNQQLIGRYGLVYRGKAFVQSELESINKEFQIRPATVPVKPAVPVTPAA